MRNRKDKSRKTKWYIINFAILLFSLVLFIWFIMSKTQNSSEAFHSLATTINSIRLEKTSNLGSDLFGITSSILSLMGLIAIFVSLNTQHNIQRCREIYWEMTDLPLRFQDDYRRVALELRRLLHNYEIAFSPSTKFTDKVIFTSKSTIIATIAVWAAFTIFFYYPESNSNFFLTSESVLMLIIVTVSSSILLSFYFIIDQLRNIKEIDERLNEPQLFYDVDNDLNIPTLPLVANEIKARLLLEPTAINLNFDMKLKLLHNDALTNFNLIVDRVIVNLIDIDTKEQSKLDVFDVDVENLVHLKEKSFIIIDLENKLNVLKYKNDPRLLDTDLNTVRLSFEIQGNVCHKDESLRKRRYISDSIPLLYKNLILFDLKNIESDEGYPKIISEREQKANDGYYSADIDWI